MAGTNISEKRMDNDGRKRDNMIEEISDISIAQFAPVIERSISLGMHAGNV